MELNTYQEEAWSTILPKAESNIYLIPGLAAEAGEVAGKFAKYVRDYSWPTSNKEIEEYEQKFEDDLKKELGDVLWFVASIAKCNGFTLQEVALANLDKLQGRKERGTLGGSGDDR